MYVPLPWMKRGSSLRLTEWPIPPTSAVVWVAISVIAVYLAAAGSAGAFLAVRISPAACWMDLTMFT